MLFQEENWDQYRTKANQQALELSEVFSGNRPLARVEKNDRLNKWFKDIGEEITSLDLNEPGPSGRKIIQLIQALKEVKGNFVFPLYKCNYSKPLIWPTSL